MLERLSERAGADPAIGLLAALVRLDLAPDDGASAKLRAAIQRFPADRRLPATAGSESGGAGLPATSTRIRPARIPPANRRAASTRTPTPMRSSGRSNQDARRSALTPPCFPPRPSGGRHCRRSGPRATKGGPPGRCPPDRRMSLRLREECWYEEIPTKRRSTWCCPRPSCRNRKTPGKSRITPRSKTATAKGTGRGLYRVTSRPPKRGRANQGRQSPGQAGRSGLRATAIAMSSRL